MWNVRTSQMNLMGASVRRPPLLRVGGSAGRIPQWLLRPRCSLELARWSREPGDPTDVRIADEEEQELLVIHELKPIYE